MKNLLGISAICFVFLAVAGTHLTGFAQDKKSLLAELPTKPGAHIEKIKSLGDNEWLNLGGPTADPKWGKARGSSWGAKAMILAPDKQGAFLFGEGVHAYVKPDGHIMDDLCERTVKCILSCGLGWRISFPPFPRTWELHDGKIETVGRQSRVVAIVGGRTAAMRFEYSGFLSTESDLGTVVLCLAKGIAEA